MGEWPGSWSSLMSSSNRRRLRQGLKLGGGGGLGRDAGRPGCGVAALSRKQSKDPSSALWGPMAKRAGPGDAHRPSSSFMSCDLK